MTSLQLTLTYSNVFASMRQQEAMNWYFCLRLHIGVFGFLAHHFILLPSLPSSFVQQHTQVNPSHESLATAAVMGQSVSGSRVYGDFHSSQHPAFLLHLCSCLKDFETGGYSEGGGMALNPVVLRMLPLEVRCCHLSCHYISF